MLGYMHPQETHESFMELADLHVFMETDSGFSTMVKSNMLAKKENLGSEKQISVDPISLRDPAKPQIVTFPVSKAQKLDVLALPHLQPPSKPKLLSYSLPNSASSSPKFSNTLKTKSRNLNQVSSLPINPYRRQESIALANLERLREIHLRRSKSCGEGRASAPSEEFDLWLTKTNSLKRDKRQNSNINVYRAEVGMEENRSGAEMVDSYDEKFKCGALCLFLPGFGKAKPVRAKTDQPESVHLKEPEMGHIVVSKRASLEKFECGSWRSSAIIDDSEDEKDGSNLFYDLPLEMIRSSVSDTHSPVTTAFVFDKDRRGVLKKSSSRTTPKKSPDSSRHVRFSSASPTSHPASPTSSVTPRLGKVREDFNLFLEAQSA